MASNRRSREARQLEPLLARRPSELPDNALGPAIDDIYQAIAAHKAGHDHDWIYFTKDEITNMWLGAYNPNILIPAIPGAGILFDGNVVKIDTARNYSWLGNHSFATPIDGTISNATNATNATNAGNADTLDSYHASSFASRYSLSGAGINYGGSIQSPNEIQGQGGGAAGISLHRPGSFAINFGLDTDNKLKVGGWSLGANAYEIFHGGVMPVCKVQGAGYNIATSTAIMVSYSTELIDTHNMWSSGNPTRVVCTVAGYYLIVGNIRYNSSGNSNGIRGCSIKVNSVEVGNTTGTPSPTDPTITQASAIKYLNVNDYIELQSWQTSGATIYIQASGEYSPSLMVVRVA